MMFWLWYWSLPDGHICFRETLPTWRWMLHFPQNTDNDLPDYMCYNPVNHNVNLNCHENLSWMLCRGSQLWSSTSCRCTFVCADWNLWYQCVIFFQLVVETQTIKYEYYHYWKCLHQAIIIIIYFIHSCRKWQLDVSNNNITSHQNDITFTQWFITILQQHI
jgi:hypothetical protein